MKGHIFNKNRVFSEVLIFYLGGGGWVGEDFIIIIIVNEMNTTVNSQSTRRRSAAHAPRPSRTSPGAPPCCRGARTASGSDTTPRPARGCPPARGTACSAPRPDTPTRS